MAGGPTTAALATAAARSGGMGFLAAGYKTAEQLHEQVTEVRAAAQAFGVNLFAPNPLAIDPAEYRRYAGALRPLAERYGVELPLGPVEDDDHWEQKLDLLRRDPVPVVSFTFAIPPRQVIDSLRSRGASSRRPSRARPRPARRPTPALTRSRSRAARPAATPPPSPPAVSPSRSQPPCLSR